MTKRVGNKYSGVIFDFNGTLFWDTQLHNIAWNKFLGKYGISFSDHEFFNLIHGKNNSDLLKELFEGIDEDDIHSYSLEKERIYYQLCRDKGHKALAPGAEDFINFLRLEEIPYTIATASSIENLEFYIEYIGIDKWFDRDLIVYNNGVIKSKPNPEIYEIAVKRLNRKPNEVVVFEDANIGLKAAQAAQAGKLVVVNSNNEDYEDWKNLQIITNFDQVDRKIFETNKTSSNNDKEA